VRHGESAIDGGVDAEEAKEDEQEDDIVDPNDPLYGLDARLSQLDLDEVSKGVLR